VTKLSPVNAVIHILRIMLGLGVLAGFGLKNVTY